MIVQALHVSINSPPLTTKPHIINHTAAVSAQPISLFSWWVDDLDGCPALASLDVAYPEEGAGEGVG